MDRGKQGLKRSTVVDANGIPLGAIAAPANRHDSPLLAPTLDTARELCAGGVTVHLDRGYASTVTRERLAARGLVGEIAPKGTPAPITASQRWPVERTNAWTNAHKKPQRSLARCYRMGRRSKPVFRAIARRKAVSHGRPGTPSSRSQPGD